jgi:tight adherence protein B
MAVVIVLIPQIRYRQKINRLIGQVPLFIDQVIRGLTTGRNVEGAIKLAAEELKEPLRDVIIRAQKSVELGMDLGDAMRDAADFHDVRELHMLALAIHTSRVYGGSPRDMLESIVKLIRQREQIRRELMAMTGETRMTAWVMGSMPSLLGGYMFMVSPDYMLEMWHDPSGQRMLIIAISMQILGALAFWRLIKSI